MLLNDANDLASLACVGDIPLGLNGDVISEMTIVILMIEVMVAAS